MSVLQRYFHAGPGYEPFLIRPGWQVAQLNFMPELQARAIRRVERHLKTDEVFVLVRGDSRLVTAAPAAGGALSFAVERMQVGMTYNVPAGAWHNIAMESGDLVIIVENDNTHRSDVEYRDFTPAEKAAWDAALEHRP